MEVMQPLEWCHGFADSGCVYEMITNLRGMMVDRLKLFQKKNNGQLPERILIYRSGISEVCRSSVCFDGLILCRPILTTSEKWNCRWSLKRSGHSVLKHLDRRYIDPSSRSSFVGRATVCGFIPPNKTALRAAEAPCPVLWLTAGSLPYTISTFSYNVRDRYTTPLQPAKNRY